MTPLSIIESIRPNYPTPLGDTQAAFLLECASATGYGLLRKPSGYNVTLPDGVKVSSDFLMERSGSVYDFLVDGDGAAIPTWRYAGEESDLNRYYEVTPHVPGPDPVPPPSDDLEERVADLEELVFVQETDIYRLETRVTELESRLSETEIQLGDLIENFDILSNVVQSVQAELAKPMVAVGTSDSRGFHTHNIKIPVFRS